MGLYHGWDGDPDRHADFIRGAVEEDDFIDEVPYRRPPRKKKKKKRRGCPENDFGPHVYVWVDFDRDWLSGYEKLVCCGCGHRSTAKKSFRSKLN